MKAMISPFRAEGSLPAQPSKSAAHRLLICAALADRETEIGLSAWNADMEATAACLTALGAGFEKAGESWTKQGEACVLKVTSSTESTAAGMLLRQQVSAVQNDETYFTLPVARYQEVQP